VLPAHVKTAVRARMATGQACTPVLAALAGLALIVKQMSMSVPVIPVDFLVNALRRAMGLRVWWAPTTASAVWVSAVSIAKLPIKSMLVR